MTTTRAHASIAALIPISLIACVALYWIGIDGPFLLDDTANINQAVITESTLEAWAGAIFSNDSGRLGRPVAAASFAFTSLFHGLDPMAFKYHNLMLHLVVGLLLWLLGQRLLRNLPNPLSETQAWYAAGAAATLWLLHPLLVSTTLYAVQRMTQLSTLFIVIALLCYTHFRTRLHEKPIAYGIAMAATVGLSGLLGVFSKENAALLPFYLLAIESVVFQWRAVTTNKNQKNNKPRQGNNTNWRTVRRILFAFHAIFVFIPLLGALIYVILKWPGFTEGYANRDFSLSERLLTQVHILWFYLKNILLPRAAELTLFHDAYPIQTSLNFVTAIAIVGHAAIIATAVALIKRTPILTFGIAVFYFSHLLESTFIPLELVFEHRNYFAAWGPLLVLAHYLTCAPENQKSMVWLRRTILIGLTVLFAFVTHTRALTWEKDELLNITALQTYPTSVRALTNLANMNLKRGHIKQARPYLERAMNASQNEAGPAIHLLYTYCHSESYPQELYDTVLDRLRTGIASAYTQNGAYNLATLKTREQCPSIGIEITASLLKAFLKNPGVTKKVRYYLLLQLGRIYLADNRPEHARPYFTEAVSLQSYVVHPNRLMALEGLVFTDLKLHDFESARKSVIKIDSYIKDPRFKTVFNTESMLKTLKTVNLEKVKSRILGGNTPEAGLD